MPIVLVTPPTIVGRDGPFLKTLLAAGFEVRFPTPAGHRLSKAELIPNLIGVSAVLAGPEVYSRDILQSHSDLRVLARCGVGFDNFDLQAASESGIVAGYAPGANHEAVGEHAMGLILATSRQFRSRDAIVRAGKFDRTPVLPLRGRTLGIIGLGRTGTATAIRARAFGMEILALEPFPSAENVAVTGATLVSADELYAAADVISIHCPLNEQTRNLINEGAIAKMRSGAILICTARGGIVDEAALSLALHAGHISAAGFDVFENEPPIGSPLLDAPNTFLTPHIAGIDTSSIELMALFAAEVIVDLHRGRWPTERLLNASSLPNWKW